MNGNSTAANAVPISTNLPKRAQAGDPDAFAALFHTYKTRIYSVCLRMTNNAAEAEDLTQEAFLQAFRKIGLFRGDSAFSTWLHRIAVNSVLMHFRKKSLYQVSLDEPYADDDGTKMRRQCGTRDSALEGCVDRIALARVLKELPPGYRTIFVLHEVEGYEHQEIAEMLSCSAGTSKSQLHKAKLRIRELLTHTGGTPRAIRNAQSSTRKRVNRDRKTWVRPIGGDISMPAGRLVAQLPGTSARSAP